MNKIKVRVSPKYQVVIPKVIREELKIQPGQELLVYIYEGRLHLDPPRSVKEMPGMARGISWRENYRDRSDRF
jgi:AbrB family looped-hinge helix DNA binding protein